MTKIFSFLVLLLVFSKCVAQSTQANENLLYKQIQVYTDTTYVVEVSNSDTFSNHRDHFFLSKKDTLINIYYYGNPLKGILMPKEIAARLKYMAAIDTKRVSLNLKFSPEFISKENGLKFWNSLRRLEPWKLKDVGRENCSQIYDGWTLRFNMIVNNRITSLTFDNPDRYEKSCPGNLNRQKALQIYYMFLKYFGRKQ